MGLLTETVRNIIMRFSTEFVEHPYFCYTEHGLHAYFFSMLFSAMPEDLRHINYGNYKVCVVQKEYPTASNLGKPKRQHWDIAAIQSPQETKKCGRRLLLDFLRLDSVIEFGINEAIEHLDDDIMRLTHPEANVDNGFIIHLYRLSQKGKLISNRDWPSSSKRVALLETVAGLTKKCSNQRNLEIFYCMYDSTGRYQNGAWHIKRGIINKLLE